MTTPEKVLEKCPDLTTLPMVYHKLNEAIQSPSCTTGISRIISHDPILTMKVLKMVNSAFYGFPHEIEDIPQALLIIGMQQLNDLVLANTVIKLFEKQKVKIFTMDDFWRYSLASGLTSKILASCSKDRHSERVFVAGLINAVGKLIMAIAEPEMFEKAFNLSIEKEIPSYVAEKEVFGFDHQEMNLTVMQSWSLPHSLTDIAGNILTPDNSQEHQKEAHLIGLASTICHSLKIGSCGTYFIPEIPVNTWEMTSLQPGIIDEVVISLKNQYHDILNTFLN